MLYNLIKTNEINNTFEVLVEGIDSKRKMRGELLYHAEYADVGDTFIVQESKGE